MNPKEIIIKLKAIGRKLNQPTDQATRDKEMAYLLGFIDGLPDPKPDKPKIDKK